MMSASYQGLLAAQRDKMDTAICRGRRLLKPVKAKPESGSQRGKGILTENMNRSLAIKGDHP